MLAWIFPLIIAAVIVANGSFVFRWALPDEQAVIRRRRLLLHVFVGVMLLFFASCFTSLWEHASEYVMVPLLFAISAVCCFCVGWSTLFSRFEVLNKVLSVVAFLAGMFFLSIAIIACLFWALRGTVTGK